MKICILVLFFSVLNFVAISQIYSPQVDSIVMQDGKKLAADIYVVSGGGQHPTILIQTPYNRLFYRWGLPLGIGANLNSYGYNFVIVDWRGFYGSVGATVANPNRGRDGRDVVEWIALQTWSDGKVGTWGPSALGKIQFQTAKENPPHLVCCAPLVAGSQFDYNEYYPGGVYRTEYVQQLDALGYGLSAFVLANPYYNTIWQYLESTNFYPSSIQVPCFMIGGWYDHNVELMLELFAGIRQLSPSTVKTKHKLLMGPWAHGGFGQAQVGTCMQGELVFNEACEWSDSLALRFLDFYLKGQANGWESEPVIRYFQIGENTWNETPSWPPSGYSNQLLYFQNSGQLSTVIPSSTNSFSTITYDPDDPSPTHGGPTLRQDQLQGPYDQSQVVETRNDIAVFTSPSFTSSYKISGKPMVHLWIKSNRKDTDFAVRLCDVYPDNRSMIISDGIIRMRFRNGFAVSDTASMIPGQYYEADIELPNTAYTFLPGHSIRVDITSSNYPRFDNNLNNGSTMYVTGDTLVATNLVFHENNHASYLQLPSSDNNKIFIVTNKIDVSIFPNPASDYLVINWTGNELFYNVEMINSLGQVEQSKKIYKNYRWDISACTNGFYLFKLYNKGELMDIKKMIIHKTE